MIYLRALSIAATVGLSGYLLKSYNTKNQEKHKNISEIQNTIHDLNFTKKIYLDKNPEKSIDNKWWNNIFKLNADEFNPQPPQQPIPPHAPPQPPAQLVGPQTPWNYLRSVIGDKSLSNDLRSSAYDILKIRNALIAYPEHEQTIGNFLRQQHQQNANVYGLQAAIDELKNLKSSRIRLENKLIEAVNTVQLVHSTNGNYNVLVAHKKHIMQRFAIVKENLVKTKAKACLVYDERGIDLTYDENRGEIDAVEGAHANRNVPSGRYVDPKMPSAICIKYDNFKVCYTKCNRVPIRTEETVTYKNVAEIEHRHWQLINIEVDIPLPFKAATNMRENNYFDNVRIGCADLYPEPEPEPAGAAAACSSVEQPVCELCQNTPFWPLFYRYVKFLTEMYDTVHIYSGALYRPNPIPEQPTYEQNYAELTTDDPPTHFYKCIYVDYGNKTCRFECYIIPNKCMQDEIPTLHRYLVNKEMLERRLTYDIPIKETIKDTTPHKFFDFT